MGIDLFYRILIFLDSLVVMLNFLPVIAHTLPVLFFTNLGIFYLAFQVASGFFELPPVQFKITAKFFRRLIKGAYYQ
jgi:hypothetical protein